jgi:hypothetical protein
VEQFQTKSKLNWHNIKKSSSPVMKGDKGVTNAQILADLTTRKLWAVDIMK